MLSHKTRTQIRNCKAGLQIFVFPAEIFTNTLWTNLRFRFCDFCVSCFPRKERILKGGLTSRSQSTLCQNFVDLFKDVFFSSRNYESIFEICESPIKLRCWSWPNTTSKLVTFSGRLIVFVAHSSNTNSTK